jgi:hypothetical protein
VAKRDLKEHEYICGAKTEQCDKCHQYIPIKDMFRHHDNKCDGEWHELNKHIDVNKLEVVSKNKRRVTNPGDKEFIKRTENVDNNKPLHGAKIVANVEKAVSIKVDLPNKDRLLHNKVVTDNSKQHVIEKPKETHMVVDKYSRYSNKVDLDKARQTMNNMLKENAKNSVIASTPSVSSTNPVTTTTKPKSNIKADLKQIHSNYNHQNGLIKHRIDLNSHKVEPSLENKVKQDVHKFDAKLHNKSTTTNSSHKKDIVNKSDLINHLGSNDVRNDPINKKPDKKFDKHDKFDLHLVDKNNKHDIVDKKSDKQVIKTDSKR